METGYYYWTYRNHPDSPSTDLEYDGLLYAQSSHKAHKTAQEYAATAAGEDFEYNRGVLIIQPVNSIVRNVHGVDDIEELAGEPVDERRIISIIREEMTSDVVRAVSERQQNIDDGGENILNIGFTQEE